MRLRTCLTLGVSLLGSVAHAQTIPLNPEQPWGSWFIGTVVLLGGAATAGGFCRSGCKTQPLKQGGAESYLQVTRHPPTDPAERLPSPPD